MVDQLSKAARPNPMEHLPAIPLDAWLDTYTTLRLWSQVVGKIRLALSPMMNHWWQVTLYLTPRGLTTSTMFYGRDTLQIDFDFIDHALLVQKSSGETRSLMLPGQSVASFYRELMTAMQELGIEPKIWPVPVEVEEQIPFEQDEKHATYDGASARRFWQVLLQVDRVMKIFRARFTGKASPVQLFWGSFDLSANRYCGRRAPLNEHAFHVAKYVIEETYIEESSDCGFWAGDGIGEPAFYAYHYPEPEGYKDASVQPEGAYYDTKLREFILPYEAVRQRPDWEEAVLSFFQSTYEAGANLSKWNREQLENSFLIKPVNS